MDSDNNNVLKYIDHKGRLAYMPRLYYNVVVFLADQSVERSF